MEYEDRMDKIFGHSNWKHRTLRTIFDSGSSEWKETTLENKTDYLQKIIDSGEDIESLLNEYRSRYWEMNKNHIVNNIEDGLLHLLLHKMKN